MARKIEEGYIIERHNGNTVSYVFNKPRIAWEDPKLPQGLIDYWKAHSNQPKQVTNKVIKVTITTEDI